MSEIEPSVDPQNCRNMTEVRAGVDAVDRALVELLVRRFGYMDAAARIKTDRTAVRDEARKAEVSPTCEKRLWRRDCRKSRSCNFGISLSKARSRMNSPNGTPAEAD